MRTHKFEEMPATTPSVAHTSRSSSTRKPHREVRVYLAEVYPEGAEEDPVLIATVKGDEPWENALGRAPEKHVKNQAQAHKNAR